MRLIQMADGNIQALRPLGIACATTLAQDNEKPYVWHGKLLLGSLPQRSS